MSSDRESVAGLFLSIAEFQYRQTLLVPEAAAVPEDGEEVSLRLTEQRMMERLAQERMAGYAEAETSLRQDFKQRSQRETSRISTALTQFEQERRAYFTRVEDEIVQLALAIARKILHREAQVDPMLLAAIVQIALGQLKEGAAASLRLKPEEAQRWRDHFAAGALTGVVDVIEDADLQPGDCVLETELGKVNFSLDVQLKEVESGFFDVLAQKPQI